jgi:hypothetical protein
MDAKAMGTETKQATIVWHFPYYFSTPGLHTGGGYVPLKERVFKKNWYNYNSIFFKLVIVVSIAIALSELHARRGQF